MSDTRTCKCGHKSYDHIGQGRCDEPSKRCGCGVFRECAHSSLRPWRSRWVCETCMQVRDLVDALPQEDQ